MQRPTPFCLQIYWLKIAFKHVFFIFTNMYCNYLKCFKFWLQTWFFRTLWMWFKITLWTLQDSLIALWYERRLKLYSFLWRSLSFTYAHRRWRLSNKQTASTLDLLYWARNQGVSVWISDATEISYQRIFMWAVNGKNKPEKHKKKKRCVWHGSLHVMNALSRSFCGITMWMPWNHWNLSETAH